MIVDFSTNFTKDTGTTKQGYFSISDRNIVLSNNYQSRIIRAFSKIPYKFSFHIFDIKDPPSKNLILTVDRKNHVYNHQNVNCIKKHKDIITVIYSENISLHKIPLTPWILAHRIHHACIICNPNIAYKNPSSIFELDNFHRNLPIKQIINDILTLVVDEKHPYFTTSKYYPEMMLTNMLIELMTMNSVRDRTMLNSGDLNAELFAQYIITGSVKLNRVDNINFKNLLGKHPTFPIHSVKHKSSIDSLINHLEDSINTVCKVSLDSVVGRKLIF